MADMKTLYRILMTACAAAAVLCSCQKKSIERVAPVLKAPDAAQITGALEGDNYVWSWPAQNANMRVITYREGTIFSDETVSGTQYTHSNVPTNVPFEYVFKLTDGEHVSTGVVKTYTRPGATSISGVSMRQLDKLGGYDALVEWDAAKDATSILLTATNGSDTEVATLDGKATSYTISDVVDGETWWVTLVASNAQGPALATSSSLRIGKTAIGFLSIYDTPEKLVADGDDDEASAWLWLHETYPTAEFVCFDDIDGVEDIERFRVLFWLRDLEGVGEAEVFAMPANVEAATPTIKEWYKNGGSLLLWSHATVYAGHLGRVSLDEMKSNDRAIGAGPGRWPWSSTRTTSSRRIIPRTPSTRAWKWKRRLTPSSSPSRDPVGRKTTTACSSTCPACGPESATRKKPATRSSPRSSVFTRWEPGTARFGG